MKSKILLFKSKLYLIIFILTLFKVFFSTTFLYAESFNIKNIEISKKFNMNFQKDEVIDDGFKIAFQKLILSITKSSDQNKLKKLSLLNIKTIIDNFSIKEEKFIDNIYYVNLDVSFNKRKIFSLLEKENIFPSLPKDKKVLFIPILVNQNKKDLLLFSENIFFQNWLKKSTDENQLIYIMPTEELEDIQLIKSKYDYLEEYDFKEIINKYSLDAYIISLFYINNKDLRILSKIKLSEQLVIDNKEFKNFKIEEISDTIKQLKVIFDDYWKQENQINTSIKLPLFIAINIADDEKIIKFEESIKKFDLVSSYRVSKLDNKKIYYKVVFNGTPKSFILQMKNFGHELDIKKKIWILK
ncbi:hypothetical protein IDG49_01565 [Pelagibacterales bacterium SAG-MED07]|nr:hypothetical protein [Pelagibacterales bacterium SAG-MED07]